MKDLCAAFGDSIREGWARLEDKLKEMALTPEEVDFCWEIAVQGKTMTGKEMTAACSLFKGRLPYNCPLSAALGQFDELQNSKSLIYIQEKCLPGA